MTAKLIAMFTVGVSSAILEKMLEANGKNTPAQWVNIGSTGTIITIGLGIVKEVIDGLRSL